MIDPQPVEALWSRLELVGEFLLESPLRIGGADGRDLALDSAERPVIPASTFRGALRAIVGAIARSLDADFPPTIRHVTVSAANGKPLALIRRVALGCNSAAKQADDGEYQGCLTEAIVARWQADPLLRSALDQTLAACTCMTCRLFGTPWLAGRVRMADLALLPATWNGTFVLAGRSRRRAVPAGTRFRFRLNAERATFAEQGLVLLGLRALESGAAALGSERAAGLGRGRLALDWWNCRYLDAALLIDSMRDQGSEAAIPFSETDANLRIQALETYLESLAGRIPDSRSELPGT